MDRNTSENVLAFILGFFVSMVLFAMLLNVGALWRAGPPAAQTSPKECIEVCSERIEYFETMRDMAKVALDRKPND